jgi:hypothetical protein
VIPVPTSVPPLVEAPMDKLLRLKALQQRLADLNRRIAVEAPPRPDPSGRAKSLQLRTLCGPQT